MFCPNCGKQIDDNATYCVHCRKSINMSGQESYSLPPTKSKYTQEEQTNIVGMAIELEAAIEAEKKQLQALPAECFRPASKAPEKPQAPSYFEPSFVPVPPPKYIQPDYPEIVIKDFMDWAAENSTINKFLYIRKGSVATVIRRILFPLWSWIYVMPVGAIIGFIIGLIIGLIIGYPDMEVAITGLVFGCTVAPFITTSLWLYMIIAPVLKKDTYKKNLEQIKTEYKNSDEYKNKCEAAIKAAETRNEQIRLKYESDVKSNQDNYDNSIIIRKKIYEKAMESYYMDLGKYNRDLAKWESDKKVWEEEKATWESTQRIKLAFIHQDLAENTEALETLYSSTKLIPLSYRSMDRMNWIYEDMKSSEHDIERAIDLLNTKEIKDELQHTQNRINEVRNVLEIGFIHVYAAIQESNSLNSEIIAQQNEMLANQDEMKLQQYALILQQSEIIQNLEKIRQSAKTGNFLNAGIILQNLRNTKLLSQMNKNTKR